MTADQTPTQELVLEVLAARHRLGECIWTFSRRPAITVALDQLAELGLVGYDSGVVERTWKAWLTDAGRNVAMSSTYQPPSMPAIARHQYEVRWAEEVGGEHVRSFGCDSKTDADDLAEEMRTGVNKAGLRRKPYRYGDVSVWECAVTAWRRLS